MDVQAIIDTLFELVLVLEMIANGTTDDTARAAAGLAKRELWRAAQALDDLGYEGDGVRSA